MPSFARSAIVAATVIASASALDPTSKSNVAVYWGQGANQQPLLETCKNPSIDIVNLAFVDVFPDQGAGGYPGTNFGNACGGEVFAHDGTNTSLLDCPSIGSDITACQETYGTKIFLSLGGGYPNNYYIDSDDSATSFANFIWGGTWIEGGNLV